MGETKSPKKHNKSFAALPVLVEQVFVEPDPIDDFADVNSVFIGQWGYWAGIKSRQKSLGVKN